ncbi:hypothetical protein K3495_g16983, partial [Podosphaera aphanis]
MSSSNSNTDKVVLGNGVTLAKWRIALQAELAKELVIGHVFHDYCGIRPVVRPENPVADSSPTAENYQQQLDNYHRLLEVWTLGEIKAKS